jgi:hypothetical protein
LCDAPATWTGLTIEVRAAAGGEGDIPLEPTGHLAMERAAMRCVFKMDHPLAPAALIHPYLAPAAAIAASWTGWQTFHAGAFVHAGGAWVVLGAPSSGKSTLLAILAGRGVPVLADDLTCVRSGAVAAGPRCLDLRPDAAAALSAGEPLGVVGARERWRVALPGVQPETPLRGWVQLGWGDVPEAVELGPGRTIDAIARHVAVAAGRADYAGLLELAAAPLIDFRRPRDIDRSDAHTDGLMAELERVARERPLEDGLPTPG